MGNPQEEVTEVQRRDEGSAVLISLLLAPFLCGAVIVGLLLYLLK